MYKANPNYILRNVAGSTILISVKENVANFNGYIELNSTASCIWKALKQPVEKQDLYQAICNEFQIDRETAQKDVDEFLAVLSEHHMVDEV